MVANSVYSITDKRAQRAEAEQSIFNVLKQIKTGEISLDTIPQLLKGQWVGICSEFHEQRTDNGVEGYRKAYRSAMTKLPVLRQWENELFSLDTADIPPLPVEAQLPHVPLAEISPFLATYEVFSSQVSPEGYEDFHLACGLWLLSTIAGRRIYVDLATQQYTPLAVALVARTSLFAKSTTAAAAIRILKESGLNWLLGDDETTPQKLLSDMAGHVPTNYSELDDEHKERVRQRLSMSGQIGWYYDEFNQLIDAMARSGPMQDFAGLLRRLDNCPDEYKYSTKSGGQEIIKQPYLALLASTTPANLSKHAAKGAAFWNDGMWSRFMFITPRPNDFKNETMKRGHIPIPSMLIQKLHQWNKRLGVPTCEVEEETDESGRGTRRFIVNREDINPTEIKLSDEAYDAYNRYRIALRKLTAESFNQDLDGSYVRSSDRALRIAALIASLENYDCIDLRIWTVAQQITEVHRKNLHELYAQINTTVEESPLEDCLIEFLRNHPGKLFTAREIYQSVRKLQSLGVAGIRNILMSLEQDAIAECKKEGRKECYKLAENPKV